MNVAIIPNFEPIKVGLDDKLTMVIRPGYNGKFVIYVVNKLGEYVTFPEDLLIYNIYRQKYWDMNEGEMYYVGSLLEAFEIYYKKVRIIENEDYLTMEQYFDSPLTTKDHYYKELTLLFKGDTKAGSNIVKVSTTEELDIGYTVSGQGIPLFSFITDINHELKKIKLNNVSTETFINTTVKVI